MAQTMERQGAGKTIKRPPCACTEGEAFRLTVRRQPGTAVSGSPLLSLYTSYVRVRASARKAAWALPPSSVLPFFCRRCTGCKAAWALPPSFIGHLVPSRNYHTGLAIKYAFRRSRACRPAFSTSRPRTLFHLPHQAAPRHAHSRRRDLRHSASAYR